MKKYILIILSVICMLSLVACNKRDTFEITITIPAGTTKEFVYQEDFIYSDEEISPTKDSIIISYPSQGLGDTSVVLRPIEVKEENAYEPTHLTPGMPIEIDVEKGAWFKVGIAMQNPTDEDIRVTLKIENVEVRIE